MFTQCVYVFCVALRANSTDQELNDFYNRDGVCLLHGTDWSFYVKCTLVQAVRLCTGRTAHRGSRGIALLFHDQRQ